MPISNNDTINEDLSKALYETTSLAQSLLKEIQTNATSLATLQTKLENLGESVESLSKIIRDGNGRGSLITRMALLEQDLGNIKDQLGDHAEDKKTFETEIHSRITKIKDKFDDNIKVEKNFGQEKFLNFLKIAAAALPGAIALIIKLVEMWNK